MLSLMELIVSKYEHSHDIPGWISRKRVRCQESIWKLLRDELGSSFDTRFVSLQLVQLLFENINEIEHVVDQNDEIALYFPRLKAKTPERVNGLNESNIFKAVRSRTKFLEQAKLRSQILARTQQKAALQSALRKSRNKLHISKNAATSRIRYATYCNLEILNLMH